MAGTQIGCSATVLCIRNGSGADPAGALRVYGQQVLPALPSARL